MDLETEGLAGAQPIFLLVTWTVLLSVFAHGLTAQPGAKRYGARAEGLGEDSEAPELDSVERFFLSTARMTGGASKRGESGQASPGRPPSGQ